MKNILIAEDEATIRELVSQGLTDCGYEVQAIAGGDEAWALLQNKKFDLLVIDVRMPNMSGVEVCRKIRHNQGYSMPIIVLTALGSNEDVVMALRAGADDYIVKPFNFTELLARVEIQLRRREMQTSAGEKHYADMIMNPTNRKVIRENRVIKLSAKEYRLLDYLMTHAGEIISRQELLLNVWDKDMNTSTNIVDVYIRYLRTKIDEPFKEKLIHTVVGQGYILRK